MWGCAVGGVLIAARAFQGIGAALLTPGSLAIIEASFEPDSRGSAVGRGAGLGGVATALGPLLGGWLVTSLSWRLIFSIALFRSRPSPRRWPRGTCPRRGIREWASWRSICPVPGWRRSGWRA